MSDEHAMDEVTDLIASIEMHRQEIERESGLEVSREYALRRLQQALQEEQEAARQDGAGPARAAAAELLAAEVKRVGSLSRGAAQRPAQGKGQPQQHRKFRQDKQQRPGSKPGGRRHSGRNSGR